ncbi:hypothetical protein [Mesorhizobium sp. Z1-4]|uniref:hypothetical protein n=1 Tax=Mesorhizobium sp. Z1-4 TaxID=2448478 RepID=UPI000FDB0013|nr:hypothetical protein [Mesorhizobium sp. Z1-4]
MPLQNRVDPFGDILTRPARGLFTGNRGVIHDPVTKTLRKRRWTSKAWIICDLVHPRGATREVFGRNTPSGGAGWTELFFADEVTALAAGHRPCFYCRREAAKSYAAAFARAFGRQAPKVPEIDTLLHSERLAAGADPRPITEADVRTLPDGAMVAIGSKPFAMRQGKLLPWSFEGYRGPPSLCRSLPARAFLITPPATVGVLKAGYRPVWHESAGKR